MLRLTHPLWQAAYRPFFFCTGFWALVAPTVWLWPGGLGRDPIGWHLHELIFGMGGAAIGGYLLTALPNWTGTDPVPPRRVRALTLLWCVSRLAWPSNGVLPYWLVLGLALGYFALLGTTVGFRIIKAGAWPRLFFLVAIAALSLAQAALLFGHIRDRTVVPQALTSVLILACLLSIVGGRAVPAFSESWRRQSAASGRIGILPALVAAPALLIALAAFLLLYSRNDLAGWLLIGASGLQFLNTMGWRILRARPYPALLMLQAAWLWLPAGLSLLGGGLLRPQILAPTTALHALTMGAMGSMILAISARAAMRRSGTRLLAGVGFSLAFGLVWTSPLIRLLPSNTALGAFNPVNVSAAVWMVGWAAFLWAFRPALHGDVPSPVLSARLSERP